MARGHSNGELASGKLASGKLRTTHEEQEDSMSHDIAMHYRVPIVSARQGHRAANHLEDLSWRVATWKTQALGVVDCR